MKCLWVLLKQSSFTKPNAPNICFVLSLLSSHFPLYESNFSSSDLVEPFLSHKCQRSTSSLSQKSCTMQSVFPAKHHKVHWYLLLFHPLGNHTSSAFIAAQRWGDVINTFCRLDGNCSWGFCASTRSAELSVSLLETQLNNHFLFFFCFPCEEK